MEDPRTGSGRQKATHEQSMIREKEEELEIRKFPMIFMTSCRKRSKSRGRQQEG